MIPELGHFSLIVGFCLALCPLWSLLLKPNIHTQAITKSLLVTQFYCTFLSVLVLIFCFVTSDFSVSYVANHSNTQLPWFYKLTALWGAHEGSILLWLLILNFWSIFFIRFKIPKKVHITAFRMLSFLQAGIALFILITSNPFLRLLPNIPIEGSDLNPLLQDPLFVLHPPILYLGYVGLSIPFVICLAALVQNDWSESVIQAIRKTTLIAWTCLTIGITLGSWWAYYELGWGGWWFWDPVENASFMPWLSATALLHLIVTFQKRQIFLGLVVFFALLSFSLSLLGTFLVRSGVLTSVHAFASDPARGIYILIFISIVIVSAFILYAVRFKFSENFVHPWSKESFILLQALCIFVAIATVLLGTLYPLIADALFGHKLSVGPPYFNSVLLPIFLFLLLLLSFGPWLYWKAHPVQLKRSSGIIMLCAGLIFLGAKYFLISIYSAMALAGVIGAIIFGAYCVFKRKMPVRQVLFSPMLWAHFGVVLLILGVTVSNIFEEEKEIVLKLQQPVFIQNYSFELRKLAATRSGNYEGVKATIAIFKNNVFLKNLYPEKRMYFPREMVLSEAAINPGFIDELYVALGEPLESGWSMRIYIKPFVRFIWLGGLLMALGGVGAVFKRKKNRTSKTLWVKRIG